MPLFPVSVLLLQPPAHIHLICRGEKMIIKKKGGTKSRQQKERRRERNLHMRQQYSGAQLIYQDRS